MLGDGRGDRGGGRARSTQLPAGTPVVLDPVMVAESGAALLAPEARAALRRAAAAARDGRHAEPARGARARGRRRRRSAAAGRARPAARARARPALSSWSPAVTATRARDLFFDGERLVEIPGERHPDGAAHGSGCTHSSALAAQLALGHDPLEAARAARAIAAEAVRDGLREIGRGRRAGRRAGPRRDGCARRRRRGRERARWPAGRGSQRAPRVALP